MTKQDLKLCVGCQLPVNRVHDGGRGWGIYADELVGEKPIYRFAWICLPCGDDEGTRQEIITKQSAKQPSYKNLRIEKVTIAG